MAVSRFHKTRWLFIFLCLLAAGLLGLRQPTTSDDRGIRRIGAQGAVVKNYLKTWESVLKSRSPRILDLAPESVQSLPPFSMDAAVDIGLPGAIVTRWHARSTNIRVNPWKNLHARWVEHSTISYVHATMPHLNVRDDVTCEPDVRLVIHGHDADGTRREDRLNLSLLFDFSGPLPIIRDATLKSADTIQYSDSAPFSDEAVRRGLAFHHAGGISREDLKYAIYAFMGGGIAVGDVDGDGWDDIYLVGGKAGSSRLFKNDGGRFTDITERAQVCDSTDGAMAAAMEDIDVDGDKDIVVTHAFKPTTLFRNRGDAVFDTEELEPANQVTEQGAAAVSIADVDNDGDADIYVAYYGPVMDEVPDTVFIGLNGLQDRLYINDGKGRFSEEAITRGLRESRWTFQGAFADFDDDGDVDLYQVNDFGRNTLYMNDGTGHFTDATLTWRGSEAFGFGMSGCWGDYSGDGKLDLYISGIASGIQWFAEEPAVLSFYFDNLKRSGYLPLKQVERLVADLKPYSEGDVVSTFPKMRRTYFQGNVLLRRDERQFVDVSASTGTYYAQWAWGSGFVDYQNDGLPDVFSTAGFITGKKSDDL